MVELNNTTFAISGMSDIPSWFSLVLVIAITTILLILFIMIISNFNFYKRFKKFIDLLGNSFKYFWIGILTIICLGVPISVFYYFITQAKKGNTVPLWVTFTLIGGYFIISFIGWLSKKYIYDRVKSFESKLKKVKKDEKN